MTTERIEEVRDKYLYICDNAAAKYNLDEDGKQDLVLYYLELCQNKPDVVRKGSYRLYGYLYSRAERILRRREREAVRECRLRNASSTMTLFRRWRIRFGVRAYLKKLSSSCLHWLPGKSRSSVRLQWEGRLR